MKMFLGEYNPNMTAGSRLALPKRMREQIAESSIVLTRGLEKCIQIYDKEDWQEQAEKFISNSKEDTANAKTRDIERYIFASAMGVNIDSQGRFVIPSSLIDYAEINEQTAIVGVGNRIELWDKNLWDQHFGRISNELSQ